MGIGIKYFIIDENDNLNNISTKQIEKLIKRDPNINFPEFAGKKIKYVTVIIENQNRKAISISSIKGHFLNFDRDGKIDLSKYNEEMQIAMGMIAIPSSTDESTNLLNATSKFKEMRYKQTYTWEISPQIEKRIYDAIFKNPSTRLLD